MAENVLVVHLETNCANPVNQYHSTKLMSSEECSEINDCDIIRYQEHTLKTTRQISLVDKQSNSAENSEQCCQQVPNPQDEFSEKFGSKSDKQEYDNSDTLQDTTLNCGIVDFHSDYYNEILNYINTKTLPDNTSLSYRMLLKKRAKNYSVKNGILFYGTKRVLKTKVEQMKVLEEIHVEKNSGIHLGVKKMSHIINSQWYWRGQYVDVANFVRQCTKCTELTASSASKDYSEVDAVIEDPKFYVHEIWKKVEVHLHGPYCKNDGLSVFIATIVDPVSQYIVAKVVPTDDCSSHLSLLILETFCTFGVVKCYFGETCSQYIDAVKLILKQQNDLIRKVKLACHHSLQDFLFILPQGEEQCLWIQSCLQPYVSNYLPVCETNLCIYIFELNTKISSTSPFLRMFNRKPCICSEDNKENTDINILQNQSSGSKFSQRRLLRSSVLQCRHCEEVFTSKISFRIHQRKHTEEAHRRGMLEGQSKCHGDRERRVARRSLSKYKHLSAKRQSLQSERNIAAPVEVRCQSMLRADVPVQRRAELRASTVEAVRRLLAKTRDNRRRRGKYKKFSSEIQEQMARYAIDHGSLLTVQHFSEKLGVIVSESTIRNIVKWYQCFTPEVKEEIGRFAAAFGIEAAASHFSERLGREVRFGLIRKFKKVYLSRFSDAKQSKVVKKTDKLKKFPTSGISNLHSDIVTYSSDMKEKIGHAIEQTVPAGVNHFSQEFNVNVKKNIRKCRKIYKGKQKALLEHQLSTNHQLSSLEQHHQTLHQQPQHQKQQQQHPPPQPLLPHHNQHHVHQLEQQHQSQLQPQQSQEQLHHLQHTSQQSLSQPSHQELQSHHHHQLQQQQLLQQQTEVQQNEPLPCDPNVALLSLQQHSSNSGLQETSIQSSNQTIDILQTSLNLLNNPQLNNSTAIIYNTPYQIPSSSHVPSSQLLSLNQQQNSSITFQTNQCSDSNIPTSVPLSYQPQEVPISASVIINQNVATVQTFPNNQMYPAFAQAHTVQPASIAVSDSSLPLPPPGNHIPSLSQHAPISAHPGLPTITVAVAPLPPDSHFSAPSNQPTVVLSQSIPQPILVSHSQTGTTLLQHIMDSQSQSQPQLQATPTRMPPQLMNEVHSSPDASSPFAQVVEQQQLVTSDTFSHSLNGNISASYNTSAPFVSESRSECFALPGNTNCVERIEMKGENCYEQLSSIESHVALVKVTNGTGSSLKASTLDSQLTSKQCSSNQGSAECSAMGDENRKSAALKPDCPEATSGELQGKKTCDKSRDHLNVSPKKNVRKKDKKAGGKGKSKTNEQKRGTYAIYSPEIRAEMGKYAAEHGSQKACDYFQRKHGYNVAESTMRGLRDKYLKKRELCSQGNDGEVTSLGYAPRGRPMRLGQYDEVVQECMQELVKSGEKISSFLAIATAKHVLMQYEPHLLEENGGKIKLNVTWAKSFLKRSGIKNYS